MSLLTLQLVKTLQINFCTEIQREVQIQYFSIKLSPHIKQT